VCSTEKACQVLSQQPWQTTNFNELTEGTCTTFQPVKPAEICSIRLGLHAFHDFHQDVRERPRAFCQPAVPQDVTTLAYSHKFQLADPKANSQADIPVEILLGGDYYWKGVKDSPPIDISTSAVLAATTLGWILSGNRSETYVNSAVVNFINWDQTFTPSGDDPRRLWDLQTIGISANHDRSVSAKDSKFLEEYRASFRVKDQSRVASLPKKQDTALPRNRLNTEKGLRTWSIETDVQWKVTLYHEEASRSHCCWGLNEQCLIFHIKQWRKKNTGRLIWL